MGIPAHARNLQNDSVSFFPAVLRFFSWLLMPDPQPIRKARGSWSAWEEKQLALEELLAIPTVLRECDGLRNNPAA
ncbi:MAG: hypothetical protein WCE63_10825 [Acidobacteriaceae bacterium]